MSLIEKAHIDWIKEVCAEHKGREQAGLEFICNIKEIAELCENTGDDKIKGIVDGLRNPKSKHSKITSKQRYAIAAFLLAKYEGIYETIAAAWDISLEEAQSPAE